MSEQTQAIHNLVQSQFGAVASAYTVSPTHANADSLQFVVELTRPQTTDRALDIATGAGHTALTLAPHVAEIVAYDITQEMLDETAKNATERGLTNLTTQIGAAEALPFADNSFDIVTVRIAPHHFADIKKAVAEMARVAKPGGRVVVVDTTVPEDDTLDAEINYIEKQRDPSHVRNYRPSEWQAMLEANNLTLYYNAVDSSSGQGRIKFSDWTKRMRTPAHIVAELDTILRNASPALVAALSIAVTPDDIMFYLPKVVIGATK